jgi:uncharacterized Tic20 family protein
VGRRVGISEEAKKAGRPTQDERVMAVGGRATIIFSAVGLIGPLIIWGKRRETSSSHRRSD